MQWIKTSERLPEGNQAVLYIDRSRIYHPQRSGIFKKEFLCIENHNVFHDLAEKYTDAKYVSYWMPYPELPTEEE